MYDSNGILFDSTYEDVMIEEQVDKEFDKYLNEMYRVVRVKKK